MCMKMTRILFICHGNICRSTMAEFVMKHLVHQEGLDDYFDIASAATSREALGEDIHYGTKQKLRQMNIPFQSRSAVQVTLADCRAYNLLIVMDYANVRNLERVVGTTFRAKTHLLLEYTVPSGCEVPPIADPWYTGNFDETYADVDKGCRALLKYLAMQ